MFVYLNIPICITRNFKINLNSLVLIKYAVRLTA